MARSLTLLALVSVVGLTACAPIDIPMPPSGPAVAAGNPDPTADQREADKRRVRLARSSEAVCKKHPDRCEKP
jgi:hypothetical protein